MRLKWPLRHLLELSLLSVSCFTQSVDRQPVCAQEGPGLYDLEYFIGTINCVQRYNYCIKNILPESSGMDCLQWGECSHLRTLNALIQDNYVQSNVLEGNPSLKKQIKQLLVSYGKQTLSNLLQSYEVSAISDMINDLIKNLASSSDTSVVTSAGLQLYGNPSKNNS